MEIERTVIDHKGDRVEATGKITYQHPVTGQMVTEDYTVTVSQSEKLPKAGWTDADLATAVGAEMAVRGLAEVASVAVKMEVAKILLVEKVLAPVEEIAVP